MRVEKIFFVLPNFTEQSVLYIGQGVVSVTFNDKQLDLDSLVVSLERLSFYQNILVRVSVNNGKTCHTLSVWQIWPLLRMKFGSRPTFIRLHFPTRTALSSLELTETAVFSTKTRKHFLVQIITCACTLHQEVLGRKGGNPRNVENPKYIKNPSAPYTYQPTCNSMRFFF